MTTNVHKKQSQSPSRRTNHWFEALGFDDAGDQFLAELQANPLLLAEMLNDLYSILLQACDYLEYAVSDTLPKPRNLSKRDKSVFSSDGNYIFSHSPDELRRMIWRITLWCDAVVKNIDPTPLHRFSEFFQRVCFDSRDWKFPPRKINLRRKAHAIEMCKDSREFVRWTIPLIQRMQNIVLLEYSRSSKGRLLDDRVLVTSSEVARMVFLSGRSIERYRKQWPKPDVAKSGRRPARWDWMRLRQIVSEQFPNLHLPIMPRRDAKNLAGKRLSLTP